MYMKASRLPQLVLMAIGILACGDDDSFDPTIYSRSYIISTGLPENGPGTLATYYPEDGKLVSDSYRLASSPGFANGISDLAVDGTNLYLVHSASQKIEVLDVKTYASKGTITYGQATSTNKRKLIQIAGGRIFVADKGSVGADFASYLKAVSVGNFDQVDSIPLAVNENFRAMTSFSDSLLVSVEGATKLIDTESLVVQGLFDFGPAKPVMSLELKSGSVYAFTALGSLARIRSPWIFSEYDITISCFEDFPGTIPGRRHVLAGDRFCLIGESNHGGGANVLSIRSIALATGDQLSESMLGSYATLAYDPVDQVVLVGGASDDTAKGTGMVTAFDAFFAVKFKIYLPGVVSKILVRP